MNIKQLLYCVILGAMLAGLVIVSFRNNSLQNQLNEEKIRNLEQIDSLTYINKQHLNTIKLYEEEISNLKTERDSLYKVKNKIIIKREEKIVSKDASSAANQLKSNLEKWRN